MEHVKARAKKYLDGAGGCGYNKPKFLEYAVESKGRTAMFGVGRPNVFMTFIKTFFQLIIFYEHTDVIKITIYTG